MKRITLFFCLLLWVISASTTIRNENQQQNQSPAERVLNRASIRKLPLVDSLKFDKLHTLPEKLKNDEIALLSKIQADKYADERTVNTDSENYYLGYRLHLSDNFHSLCIVAESEHELLSVLINYDKQFSVISALTVTYDEIAESAFYRSSTITSNEVTTQDEDWLNETVEKKVYRITPAGKFVLTQRKIEKL